MPGFWKTERKKKKRREADYQGEMIFAEDHTRSVKSKKKEENEESGLGGRRVNQIVCSPKKATNIPIFQGKG